MEGRICIQTYFSIKICENIKGNFITKPISFSTTLDTSLQNHLIDRNALQIIKDYSQTWVSKILDENPKGFQKIAEKLHRKWIRIPKDPIKFFNYCTEESREMPFSVFSRVYSIKTLETLLNSELNENVEKFNRLNKVFPNCFNSKENNKENSENLLNAPWILWKKRKPFHTLEYAVERWNLESHLLSDSAIALRKIFPKNTKEPKELLKEMDSEAANLWKNTWGKKERLDLSGLDFQSLPSEIAKLPIKFLDLSDTKVGPLPDSFKRKNWTVDIRNTPLCRFLKYKKEQKEQKGPLLKRQRARPSINEWTLITESSFKGSPLKKRLKKHRSSEIPSSQETDTL